MAFKTVNVTLSGNTQIVTAHTPVKWVRIENTTGNADVLVGDKNLSATNYGFTVTAGPAASKDIPAFSGGESPFNLDDLRLRGTDAQVVHVSYVTL